MIQRLVKLTFEEKHIEAFKEIFLTTKDKIVASEGCHHVEMWQDETRPAVFFTYSRWENVAALDQYRHSELFKKTWKRTKVLFADKPEAWSCTKLAEGNE